MSRSNGTKTKNLIHDWNVVLALPVENGWKKVIEEMARSG